MPRQLAAPAGYGIVRLGHPTLKNPYGGKGSEADEPGFVITLSSRAVSRTRRPSPRGGTPDLSLPRRRESCLRPQPLAPFQAVHAGSTFRLPLGRWQPSESWAYGEVGVTLQLLPSRRCSASALPGNPPSAFESRSWRNQAMGAGDRTRRPTTQEVVEIMLIATGTLIRAGCCVTHPVNRPITGRSPSGAGSSTLDL